ncbi:hypothetical protein BH10PAT1_BH10PAT1_2960 [soil metagenome]
MKKNKLFFVVCSFLFFFLFFVIIKKIFSGFFQQDEWLAFSEYIRISFNFKNFINDLFALNATHYVPLGRLAGFLEYKFFGLNYLFYAVFDVILHVFSVLLVYIFSKNLIKNNRFAIVSAVIFFAADYGYQVVSWPAGNLQNQISVILALVSLLYFFKFIRIKTRKMFWFSYFLLCVSILFKENAIAFFVFLPFIFYFYSDSKLRKKYFYPLFIFLTGVVYGIFKLFIIFNSSVTETVVGSQSKFSLIYNLITFPVKGIAQTIIPVDLELMIAHRIALFFPSKISGGIGTTAFDIFVEKRLLEILSFLIFSVILAVSILIYKKIKDKKFKKGIIFGLVFVMINSFIYALSPGRVGIISIIDSRNLYFLTFGSAILISIFIYLFFQKNRKLSLILFILFIGMNIFYLNSDISLVTNYGNTREYILDNIKNDYPNLPNHAVIYTESDSSFYGLPDDEKIMPFQSGFGQTLLVWYESSQNFPKKFFKDNFLWEIGSEGYKEINGTGFGYFRNYDELQKAYVENNLTPNNIIAYKYYSKENILKDITNEVRQKLIQSKKSVKK